MTYRPSPGLPPVFRFLQRDCDRPAEAKRRDPNRALKLLEQSNHYRAAQDDQHDADPQRYAAHALDVISRFGGVPELVYALGKVGFPTNKTTVYRWLYPYPRGTAGRVPHKSWLQIKVAARWAGIDLSRIRVLPLREDYYLHGVWKRAKGLR